jgi:uncharacterized protein (TIGR03435 family)
LSVLALAIATIPAAAQNADRPAFEVASVKASANCRDVTYPGGTSPGRLALTCVSLRTLIRGAFGSFTGLEVSARRTEILGGPAWLDTERFDITATAPGAASVAQMMGPMLQRLLEERFKLRLHREARETAVYELTFAASNVKLRVSAPGSCRPIELESRAPTIPRKGEPRIHRCGFGSMEIVDGRYVAVWMGTTMAEFAGRMLPAYVDRPVVDRTGLEGRWDIRLEFTREVGLAAPAYLNGEPAPAVAADPNGPSLFTALREQLGLKLVPARAPVEVIVIDGAERPTPN